MDRCDQEVYDKGTVVFLTNTIRSARMEEWVQAIAQHCGQKVDWHQFAGRSVMKALGDLHRVRKAIIHFKDMHDQFLMEALQALRFQDDENKDYVQGIWEYNYREYDLWSYVCSKCQGRCMPQNHAGWDPTQEGHG